MKIGDGPVTATVKILTVEGTLMAWLMRITVIQAITLIDEPLMSLIKPLDEKLDDTDFGGVLRQIRRSHWSDDLGLGLGLSPSVSLSMLSPKNDTFSSKNTSYETSSNRSLSDLTEEPIFTA
jgi:hypothetical protein